MPKFLHAAALTLAAAGLAGCNVGEPSPFDPVTLGQTERLASREVRTYRMDPLPTTLQSPYLGDDVPKPTTAPSTGPSLGIEPQVRMTLQEIVHRAVANNADIKVAGYTPAIDQTRVIEAESRFDPTFFANTQLQRTNRQLTFAVAGADGDNQRDTVYSGALGIRQNLESGGQIEVRNQTQVTSNPELKTGGFGHDPALQNEFVVQITQPLLRDFGNEINRARITINRNNQQISVLEFRKQIEETIADIEQTYWDLVQAERLVRIQEDLVAQTIDTAQRLLGRRGEVAPVQMSQTQAQLDSRRSTLIRAKAQVKDLSAQLKRNMNDPEYAVAGPLIVLPGTPPLEDAVYFDQKDVLDTALSNRLELGEQQLRVNSADTALKVGKNNLLPQLNAAGSISIQGLSGSVTGIIEDQLQRDYVSYSIGLELEIPIGNRSARAVYQRALMQRAQAVDAYSAQVSTIGFECDRAMRAVNTAWDALGADRQSVFAAQDALKRINTRELDGGAITPEYLQLKLQYQDTLADARRSEAASLTSYNQAIAKLEQAKGTLLQYNNVLMKEEMIPYERKWLKK